MSDTHLVHIPSPLRSYTAERASVEARGGTLGEVLEDLDRAHRGIRFRIIDEQGRVRRHIKLFAALEIEEDLTASLTPGAEVHIVAALSGG